MFKRQKILLHIRCAPCGVAVINELVKYNSLTAYFYNPNIYPRFDIFATTLSSGRQKNSIMINSIGTEISREENVPFLSDDWKKNGRQEKSARLIKEKNIYKQNYCGCKYSLK